VQERPPETGDVSEEEEAHAPAEKKPTPFWKELPVLIVMAFVLALLIKSLLVQAFFIPSESMEQTLFPGDRVLVNKVVYHLHPPHRSDVIVFENPHPTPEPARNPVAGFANWVSRGLGFSQPPDEDFIKRVIGLPGDTVTVKEEGVWVNDTKLVEPYVDLDSGPGPTGTWKVPERHYFVMGDNRGNSNDSRVSLGAIPEDKIVGQAFVIIWPPGNWGGL